MFWKKKKNYLEYSWSQQVTELKIHDELSEGMLDKFFSPAVKTSCWFNNMKTKIGNIDVSEAIKRKHKKIFKNEFVQTDDEYYTGKSYSTVKTCPGVISFFKNTYLLKVPYDIIISINSDGATVTEMSRNDGLLRIDGHGGEQYQTHGKCDLFKDKLSIKFCFGLNVRTNNIPWTFIQPIYHNEQPFTVAPGIIGDKLTNIQNLNLITFFDIPKEGVVHHHFKAGEVLAYMTFNEKVDLKYVPYDMSRKIFPRGWRNKIV